MCRVFFVAMYLSAATVESFIEVVSTGTEMQNQRRRSFELRYDTSGQM